MPRRKTRPPLLMARSSRCWSWGRWCSPGRPAADQFGVHADAADLTAAARLADRLGVAAQRFGEEPRVVADEHQLVRWRRPVLVDGVLWADRFALAAVDALAGVDVELAIPFIDAVDGTFVHTGHVHHVDAAL